MMTWRNSERSGERKLSRLSGLVRGIEGCRNMDLDLTFYCPSCSHFTVFIEIKPELVPRAQWYMTRQLARLESCWAILAVEKPDGYDLYTFDASENKYSAFRGMDDEGTRVLLAACHSQHRC